ncbi:class I tRNA ligase family protein, partial [Patescibacteria group bacterium]
MEINFSKSEEEILKFWDKNKIFEKSVKQRAKARDFVFYEGPPTANGKPGIHHILTRVFKDIICRYKTMQGFRVIRKAGWDTHGLPVELEIEKELGLKNKKEIEKYGIGPFNKKCKGSVWRYKKDWEKLTKRIAFWLDMEDPYITFETNYIETIWHILKKIWEKKLLYEGYKVVPYCPRCGTALSSHEVAQGYKKVKENSVYVKFPAKGEKSTFFLVWTTTPWTLPSNVALAVGPNIDYVKVSFDSKEKYILAKDRLEHLKEHFKIEKAEIIEKIKGKDLLDSEYEQLIKFAKPEKPAFRIVGGSFVSTQEGTGIVHIAPAFGEDDMMVARKNDLPVLMTVDEAGKFKKEIKDFSGMFVKDADPLIVEDLKSRNLLFGQELYEHDYPFCWRCRMP